MILVSVTCHDHGKASLALLKNVLHDLAQRPHLAGRMHSAVHQDVVMPAFVWKGNQKAIPEANTVHADSERVRG
jgi:hypothetical protein